VGKNSLGLPLEDAASRPLGWKQTLSGAGLTLAWKPCAFYAR
jgi:hypothetical protein